MSASIRDLAILAYGRGFTLWHYKTPSDSLKIVRSLNYFAPAGDVLSAGDMILVTTKDGGTILFVYAADTEAVSAVPLS